MSSNLVQAQHRSSYGSLSRASMISEYFRQERSENEPEASYVVLVLNRIFRLRERNTTIAAELQAGVVHFVSVAFIMAVNPALLATAGYNPGRVAVSTGIAIGLTCILSGFVTNLPFGISIVCVSIYFVLNFSCYSNCTNNSHCSVL